MPTLRTASTFSPETGSQAASTSSPATGFLRLTDTETGQVHPVDQDPCLIGRSPDLPVVLDSPYVSRKHAKIQRTREGGHLIEGLNPDSPIKINDIDVKTQRLFHGDRIGVDVVTLLFESDRPEDARPIPASDQTLYRPKSEVPPDQTLYRPKTVSEVAPSASGDRKADPGGGKGDPPGGGKGDFPGGGKGDFPGGGRVDSDGDRTILEINRPVAPIAGPRLVWHRPPTQGGDLVMAIKHPRVVVGRKPPSDLCIDDPSVSRQHLILTQKEAGFQVQAAADAIRILINEKSVTEGQICNGDRLQLGASRLTFLSDRPEDQQPTAAKTSGSGESPRSNLPIILLIVISLLAAGGYLGFHQLFVPYQMQENLNKAKILATHGNYDETLETLQPLLSATTEPALQKQARELLAQSAKIQAETMLKAETPEPAKELLRKHLRQYGTGVETDTLWEILDQIHFTLGQQQEKNEQKERAVREYLAVRSESALFPRAQEAISQIWLAQQKSRLAPADKNRTVAEKLRKADDNFQKKHFLTPPEDNAFIDYRLILADDPGNATASIRIQAMLAFYREQGDQQVAAKKYAAAMEEYQRCLVIDPNAQDIREKIAQIQVEQAKKAAAPAKKEERNSAANEKKSKENKPGKNDKGSTESAGPATAGKEVQPEPGKEDVVRQERVRKMLQESGVESNWVMDYLFKEDKEGSAKTGTEETPWKE